MCNCWKEAKRTSNNKKKFMSLLNVTVVRTTISLFLSLMWNTTTKNNLKKIFKEFFQ